MVYDICSTIWYYSTTIVVEWYAYEYQTYMFKYTSTSSYSQYLLTSSFIIHNVGRWPFQNRVVGNQSIDEEIGNCPPTYFPPPHTLVWQLQPQSVTASFFASSDCHDSDLVAGRKSHCRSGQDLQVGYELCHSPRGPPSVIPADRSLKA